MDVLLNILKWFGIGVLILMAIGLIFGLISTIIQSTKEEKGKRALAFQARIARALKPYQVFVISMYYLVWLGVVATLAYYLLYDSNSAPEQLKLIIKSETALFLAQCFCSGAVGAVVYGMLWISKGEEELQQYWRPRRYVLLPPLGALLGAGSFFFVKAGMITFRVGQGNTEISSFAVYGIAFLSGFASRELTEKLIQIAQTIFTKVPEPPLLPEIPATEYDLMALATQWEQLVAQIPSLENFRSLANLYSRLGREADILKTYARALAKLPDEAKSDRAQIYLDRARILADKGEVSPVIDSLRNAIDLDPAQVQEALRIGFQKVKGTKEFSDFMKQFFNTEATEKGKHGA